MPGGIGNDSPMARPIAVAWTSARAQRCGFYFDPGKLRASYLAYEARQSNGEQLAKSEQSYDTTFKVIRERVSADPEYCTDKKGAEIKADLQRHLKGDFTPNFPKPKVVEFVRFLRLRPGTGEVREQDVLGRAGQERRREILTRARGSLKVWAPVSNKVVALWILAARLDPRPHRIDERR